MLSKCAAPAAPNQTSRASRQRMSRLRLVAAAVTFASLLSADARLAQAQQCTVERESDGTFEVVSVPSSPGRVLWATIISFPKVPGAVQSVRGTGPHVPGFGTGINGQSAPLFVSVFASIRPANEHWVYIQFADAPESILDSNATQHERFGEDSGWEWVVTTRSPGLRSTIAASPFDAPSATEVTVEVTANNETNRTFHDVQPTAPLTLVGQGTGQVLSGPEPAMVDELGPGQSATFSYTVQTIGEGLLTFRSEVTGDNRRLGECRSVAVCDSVAASVFDAGQCASTGGVYVSIETRFGVEIRAFDSAGEEVDGDLSIDQTLDVEVRIINGTGRDLDNFAFANDELFVIDDRSPGGALIVDGPTPDLDAASLSMEAGEIVTVRYAVTTTGRGLVGAHSRVSAVDSDGDPHDDAHSLKMEIEDGQVITEELEKWLLLQIVDQAMTYAYREYYEGLRESAEDYLTQLKDSLTPDQMVKWFGDEDGVSLGNFDYMKSVLRGEPPELTDAAYIDANRFKGHTRAELGQAMEDAMFAEIGKAAEDWVDDWVDLGRNARDGAKATYREALLASFYAFGNATPEERLEFQAKMIDIAETNGATANSIYETAKQEIPRWKENGVYAGQALYDSGEQLITAIPEIKRRVKEEISPPPMELLESDPLRWHKENGKVLAKPITTVMPIVFDSIFGVGTARITVAGRNLLVKGAGGSIIRGGQAMGVVDDAGRRVKGRSTGIRRSVSSEPHGVRQADAPRNSEEFLDSLDGATVVEASDLGKVYELDNVGGVPEPTLDAKAELLTELVSDYKKVTDNDIELAVVLKPSSALRKPGGVAKFELTGQKTGKAAMVDGGMPVEALGEATVWRNRRHPNRQRGWRKLSRARKEAAVEEWKKANDRWDEYHRRNGKKPDGKTRKLKQCIGQECRVPLDDVPNAEGIQRFVTAEFEEVRIRRGSADAKLIRVKKYEIEVVDTNLGITTNRKTIVNSDTALPQTPDADGLALAKVVGRDVDGKPILERLDRAEREFLHPRYMDKVEKFRRAGKLPDAAEHGLTWMIDDASASASGVLFSKYGAPFLPSEVGVAYLSRIAKFVKPEGKSEAEMLVTMLKLVQKEGGFGQRAVVVTSDSRYFGALNVADW